ncbi:hypothetical protein AS850_15955 [Frondihabitans sp. 762G35]|nr:hypothetical protein AS850_15955 [Frondihabitans sp. 762G35]
MISCAGPDPDKILLTGDGAATGRGVVTHELGLAGFLARGLSARSERGADVTVLVRGDMTVRTCADAIDTVDLACFDIVVVSVGATEALTLARVQTWRRHLDVLLNRLEASTSAATPIFLLPIPFFGNNPGVPALLARVVDRHVQLLNAAAEESVAAHDRVTTVTVTQLAAFEPEGSHLYRRWADAIALRITAAEAPARLPPLSTDRADEDRRQRSLRDMDIRAGDDPALNRVAEGARTFFDTKIAAVTLIQSDVQIMKAAVGINPVSLPRARSFCDVTIRDSKIFVIEDARSDARYADYSIVASEPRIRFYAGYPLHSPDGQRVGALCVMDSAPRRFTAEDAEDLRGFAEEAQARLWELVGVSDSRGLGRRGVDGGRGAVEDVDHRGVDDAG